jgi:hypothetical protein
MKKVNKLNNIKGIKVGVILGVNLTGKKVTLSGEEQLVVSRAHPFTVAKKQRIKLFKTKKPAKSWLVLSSGDSSPRRIEPATLIIIYILF